MIRVILSGACGQMGQAIVRLASRREDVKIVAGLDKSAGNFGFNVYADASKCTEAADVVIDFSHPLAVNGVIDFCLNRKLPMIICTTGLTSEHLAKIKEAAIHIPVLHSSNMSMGVLFFHKLVKMAAKELYGRYDIEIVESHHNQKVDAPSGTAAALFNTVKSVVPEAEAIYERHSVSRKRDKKEVGMHSVRGGGIVGMHEVIFAGANECITLSHNAFSKDIFAAGSLDAGIYLANKPNGYYTMNDISEGK